MTVLVAADRRARVHRSIEILKGPRPHTVLGRKGRSDEGLGSFLHCAAHSARGSPPRLSSSRSFSWHQSWIARICRLASTRIVMQGRTRPIMRIWASTSTLNRSGPISSVPTFCALANTSRQSRSSEELANAVRVAPKSATWSIGDSEFWCASVIPAPHRALSCGRGGLEAVPDEWQLVRTPWSSERSAGTSRCHRFGPASGPPSSSPVSRSVTSGFADVSTAALICSLASLACASRRSLKPE